MFPTLVAFGVPDPFSTPSSFTMSAEVVGVPTSTSKLLSSTSTSTLTGTFIPAYAFVISLILLTIWRTFTPSGPRVGPSGGPAVAFPPSISASTVFFSPRLSLSSTHELDVVCVDCDGQCCEALFQQFDDDLLLHLVNVCYL